MGVWKIMVGLNLFVGMGNLTRDPEIRVAGETHIARYTLAVSGYKQDDVNYITCVAFGKSAEFAEKYLSKGTKILITGHIQTGSYKDKDGKTVYTKDVIVDHHYFCERKGETDITDTIGQMMRPKPDDGFIKVDEDDESLPFM